MEIQELTVAEEKQKVVRQILEGLPEWFGIAEAREEYIAQSAGQPCFAAMEQGKPIGFLCLKETGRDTMELAVMGVGRRTTAEAVAERFLRQQRSMRPKPGILFCR